MSVWSVPPLAGCVCAGVRATRGIVASSSHVCVGVLFWHWPDRTDVGERPAGARRARLSCVLSALCPQRTLWVLNSGHVCRASLSSLVCEHSPASACRVQFILSELTQWGVTLAHPRE